MYWVYFFSIIDRNNMGETTFSEHEYEYGTA